MDPGIEADTGRPPKDSYSWNAPGFSDSGAGLAVTSEGAATFPMTHDGVLFHVPIAFWGNSKVRLKEQPGRTGSLNAADGGL